MKGQTALSRPTVDVNVRGLTFRQRELLRLVRFDGQPVSVRYVRSHTLYSDPQRALRRLEVRGLIRKTHRGYYEAVVIGEVTQ